MLVLSLTEWHLKYIQTGISKWCSRFSRINSFSFSSSRRLCQLHMISKRSLTSSQKEKEEEEEQERSRRTLAVDWICNTILNIIVLPFNSWIIISYNSQWEAPNLLHSRHSQIWSNNTNSNRSACLNRSDPRVMIHCCGLQARFLKYLILCHPTTVDCTKQRRSRKASTLAPSNFCCKRRTKKKLLKL